MTVPPQYKKPLLVTGIILGLLILFLGLQTFRFRITGISPDNTNYPSSLGVMNIAFNRDLDKEKLTELAKVNPAHVASFDFDGTVQITADKNILTLVFSQTPVAGEYTITLNDIPAAGGASLTKKLPFIVKDIPYGELTREQKDLYRSMATETFDNDFAEYPVLANLPYETAQYKVDYTFEHSDPAPTLIITMKFFPPGSNAAPATAAEQQAYLNDLRTYRKEALAWLEAQGAKPDDFILEYSELDLEDEFPKGRPKHQGVEEQDGHDHSH